MATVAQIRDGLKTRLDTISGLRGHARMPATLNPPAAVAYRRSTTPDATMDGADDWLFAITVFVQYTDEPTAQTNLDAYLAPSGANSIRAAIDADGTLGGVVDYAVVQRIEADRIVEWSGIKYLAADLVIEVG